MNAFIDINGVLTSWGYAESNGDDQLIEVGEDFNYAPGSVRFDGGEWVPVVPGDEPPPTPEEILASQSAKLQGFTRLAAAQKAALTNRIGVINDGIELGEATPAEVAELPVRQAQLIEWKRYALYLGRVTSQEGWPPEVEWPTQPTEGMDLTVSAVAPDSSQLQ